MGITRSCRPTSTATAEEGSLFYAAGTANDYVWFGQANGTFQSTPGPVLNGATRFGR